MQVLPIRILQDNYAYAALLHSHNSYVLIDPADFEAVSKFVNTNELLRTRQLEAVFSTHKHSDHSGDNDKYRAAFPSVPIICSSTERIPTCTHLAQDEEVISVLNNVSVRCILAPCHTRGHMLYYFTLGPDSLLFTGDTLFIGGCGKFFEGSAEEMLRNFQKILSLPYTTQVFCGHEYTVANLEWAERVDYGNEDIKRKLEWARRRQNAGLPTVPGSIEEEMRINIFIRSAVMAEAIGCSGALEALARLRDWKNKGKTLI